MRIGPAAIALAACLTGTPVRADDAPAQGPQVTLGGSAAVLSQYRFRGLAHSDDQPAVQASLTASVASGFYLGVWGSSAADRHSPIKDGGGEVDLYGGYTRALGISGITADGGLYGYLYPGATRADFVELYGDLTDTYGPVGAKLGVNWAPAQRGFDSNLSSATRYDLYEYVEFTLTPPLPRFSAITLHSHVGHTGGALEYGRAYVDYTAGVSYKWRRLTFDIAAVGTTVSGEDVSRGFNGAIQAYARACGGNALAAQRACYGDGFGGVGFYRRPAKAVAVGSVTVSF